MIGDGELKAEVETRAGARGWRSVCFPGFQNQSQMPGYYDLCDVFVLPSEHEPWGLALNEVMNAAKPVIATHHVGAVRDLIDDGVTGFVYPVGNVQALSGHLAHLANQPDLAETMGRSALDRVSRFDFSADWTGLQGALEAVMGSPESRRTARPW
jgi:glycosyltransferase involved in cell wall biosynthesis